MGDFMMAEVTPAPQPGQTVDHIVPDLHIRQGALAVDTTPEMTIVICNDTGRVEMTQLEFLTLVHWQHLLIHRDWG